jgi:pSer/pThr/pTyr-binding forkhead associated (FHA) protein
MVTGAAQLEVVAGKATGMSILVEDELLFGRGAEGPGRLADDEEISRAHARVTMDGSGFCAIEDLGSTNGTFVNGLRIATPTTLAPGDAIELGKTTLVVRDVPSAVATPVEPLSLRLDVDFAAGRAQLVLQEGSEPVRFVLEAGTWRSDNAKPIEKGGPP